MAIPPSILFTSLMAAIISLSLSPTTIRLCESWAIVVAIAPFLSLKFSISPNPKWPLFPCLSMTASLRMSICLLYWKQWFSSVDTFLTTFSVTKEWGSNLMTLTISPSSFISRSFVVISLTLTV